MAADRTRTTSAFRRYTLALIACVSLPTLVLGGFVVAVDPYFVFGSPGWRGFNATRSYAELAVAKPYLMRQMRPAAVALGSSRAEVGLDPRHPGWGAQPVFNFGLPGSSSYDVMLAFLHAQAVGRPLKQAVIGLDFFGFNIFFTGDNSEREARFEDHKALATFADFLDAEMIRRGHRAVAERAVAAPLPPADWNEVAYLADNPIARVRVALGTYGNGYLQYIASGRDQGLSGGWPAGNAFETLRAQWPALSRNVFQFQERFGMVFSRLALGESLLTVRSQSSPATFDSAGMRVWQGQEEVLRKAGGAGKLFDGVLQARSWVLWLPPPRLTYCFSHPDTGASMFDPFRFMVRKAYAENTDLRLFVTPLQAAVRETFAALGLSGRYDFWLSELVRINEQEAALAGRTPFALWDFSDVNTITREELPGAADATPMRWFWEYSHYRKATGDLILDRIFGRQNAATPPPADFGVALTGQTVGAHIARSGALLAEWRAGHTGLAAKIAQSAQAPDARTRQRDTPCW